MAVRARPGGLLLWCARPSQVVSCHSPKGPCIVAYCIALRCVALRCVALRCVALQYSNVHCVTLRCT
eukprot:11162148-Lingulodinium_polyedra.AAC.1